MITFKAIIITSGKRKDGTFPVKIRVTFKGVSRRLPTTIVCKQHDLTRSNKIKNPDIINACEPLITQMREAVRDISPFELEVRDVDWVVGYIRAKLRGNTFRLDFFDWFAEFCRLKGPAAEKSYRGAVNLFADFLGRRQLDINDITARMIEDFIKYGQERGKIYYNRHTGERLESKKMKKNGAIYRHVMKLSMLFSEAKKHYNDKDGGLEVITHNPFEYIEYERIEVTGQRNLGADTMQRIISAQPKNKRQRLALDLFVVSFGFMGANIADIYKIPNIRDGVWVYNRSKTQDRRKDKAKMRVYVPEQILPYIARLQGEGGAFMGYLRDRFNTKDEATRWVNYHLTKWANDNGVERFTFYAARHTFASLARRQGVEKALVDECLAHKGDYDLADIYAERDWDLINGANEKVLALFEWPE